ncbi:MAG: alpha/beta hydrolase [Dehalococcoidia bacterium]
MATVETNGIQLYYEEHGEGEPLLLIMGWGGNAATWAPQLPGLSEHFRVIAFDNRGSGRSSAPDEPYSTVQMAEDTVGLLDALDVPRAHVFGISMGGMIAQELALAHPERVNALVLGCTSAGGPRAAGFAGLRREIQSFRATNGEGPDLEWFGEFMKTLWTDEALARSAPSVQDFVLSFIRYPPALHGMKHQAGAIATHDAHDRLSEIAHRVLVITGDKDRLVHPWNSHTLANRIPNAKLHVFTGLLHAFHLERADAVNSRIIDFIYRAA